MLDFPHKLCRPSLNPLDQSLVSTVKRPPYQIAILQVGSDQRLVQQGQRYRVDAQKESLDESKELIAFCSCSCNLLPKLQLRIQVDTQILFQVNLLQHVTLHCVDMTRVLISYMERLAFLLIEGQLPLLGP